MAMITWDATGSRLYETGVDRGVLYVYDSVQKTYKEGVAWNGLTAVTESPSGAEATPLYADNIKYLNLMSAEEFGATIEAYTYPDEFKVCNGEEELTEGVVMGQQSRSTFGMCYRTKIGNDTEADKHGYKIHIIYGCLAAPSERAYATINDSPEAITFSWEVSTTPVATDSTGTKFTACITIDSTKLSEAQLTAIENKLYGGGTDGKPELPLPSEVKSIIEGASQG